MKTVTLVNGNFSTREGGKGNFSGYTVTGKRYFVHKAQLASLGITNQDEALKALPLYAFVATRSFDKIDAEGNVIEKDGIVREQATAIFTDRQKLIEAKNADAIIDILAAKHLREQAKEADFTPEQIEKMITASL